MSDNANESKNWMPEGEEPTGVFYDFLYKDSDRIDSYYAQLFAGLLSSREESTATQESRERNVKFGSPHIAEGSTRSTKQGADGEKRVIVSHDLIVQDTLTHITQNFPIYRTPSEAPNGALVFVKGDILFIDDTILKMALPSLKSALAEVKKKPRHPAFAGAVSGLSLMVEMIPSFTLPQSFLLQTQGGGLVAGTLKEARLQEPILNYYFKHGKSGICNVGLLGIIDHQGLGITPPAGHLLEVMQGPMQALSDLLFPPDAFRVTPIAIFREISNEGQSEE